MPLGTLGKYERLDVLGHGVSGIVYLAKDTLLNKQIALKEVDVQAGDMRRFLEEARVMDRLRHPNIVRVNNVDRIDGKVVIDMEYVRGQNLQETLRSEGVLRPDRAMTIAAQILDALDYAHFMQTVHRDIKPANILLDRDEQVKLVDFGLAEILATNAYAGGAGTYAYMAPEDFAEEDRSDSQSDIWAVGVTLFEMLTLNKPFQVGRVKDPFAWKRALENELPAPLSDYLSDVPAGLQAILDRALEKNKRKRYATAGEFRDDLLHLQSGEALNPATQRHEDATTAQRIIDAAAPNDCNGHFAPLPMPAPLNGDYDLRDRADAPIPAPLPERSGPGVVVADVNQEIAPKPNSLRAANQKKQSLMSRRRQTATRLIVEPEAVDFGAVRKGDLRTAKLKVRVDGATGSVTGSVGRKPDWLTAHPMSFERSRQTLTLTAHSGRTWETGDFEDSITILTEAGTVNLPVFLRVLKPRPSFLRIAFWYVPLYIGALLPALLIATGGGGHALSTPAASLVAPAAAASGLLSLMLLLITIAADLGMAERIACGVLTAVMAFALGLAESHPTAHSNDSTQRTLMTGGLIALVMLLQVMYFSRWKVWAVALLALSLLVSSTFYRVLTG